MGLPISKEEGRLDRFMSLEEVLQATGGWSRSTVWREARAGRFPKPVPTTSQRVAWLESEVATWLAQKVAERNARHQQSESAT